MRLKGRPSPAMVLAALALVFAMVGTAVAGPDAISSAISKKKVKKIAKKQANKRINKREASLNVNSAKTADSATSATSATSADLLDGLHADQLARGTTATATTSIDGFNAAAFTDLIAREVTAPTAGVLLVFGQVNVNRDADDVDAALLRARAAVDGAEATTEANVRATETGTVDQSVSVSGAIPIAAGSHTVSLQGLEAGAGLAFLTERSITTLFVPFGNAGQQGVLSAPDRDLSGPSGGNN